jgi:hypothetical protein
MLMNRIVAVGGFLLLVGACASGTPEEVEQMEAAEDVEQTVGDERAMVGGEPGEMGGFMPPDAEEDVEMETEPYPE